MKPPKKRAKLTAIPAPAIAVAAETRTTELIGVDEDGNMALWSVGEVLPISAFPIVGEGWFIESAHYVIQWKGHAITVHCCGQVGKLIEVLFMCSYGDAKKIPFKEVEAMLIGKVIPDARDQAEFMQKLKELGEILHRKDHAPHRQRGRLS